MAEIFDRFWELNIKSNPNTQTDFSYVIKPDEFGHSLRINFDINAALGIRFYTGTIRIYNLETDKRKNLVFNILGNKIGTGPSIKLIAGYKGRSGAIMDGVVLRGHTLKEPTTGDWITVLQCGLSLNSAKTITINPSKVTGELLDTFVKNWLSIIIPEEIPGEKTDKDNRFIIKRSKGFNDNLEVAIATYLQDFTVNTTIGFSGPSAKILEEIGLMFNLIFYYDNEGFNVSSSSVPSVTPEKVISEDTGMIGSPIYTDTGAKVNNYLSADFRLLQAVSVKSDVLEKDVQITSLNHIGDTFTNAWYSSFDASNLGGLSV